MGQEGDDRDLISISELEWTGHGWDKDRGGGGVTATFSSQSCDRGMIAFSCNAGKEGGKARLVCGGGVGGEAARLDLQGSWAEVEQHSQQITSAPPSSRPIMPPVPLWARTRLRKFLASSDIY